MTTTLPAVAREATPAPTPGAVSADYLRQVRRRLREPMEPRDFSPNWDDQPSRHVIFEGAVRVPLPAPFTAPSGSLSAALATVAGSAAAEVAAGAGVAGSGLTWPVLSTLLASYGLCSRRLDLTWNDDSRGRVHTERAVWGRPTASGGGMYPVETYLATGAGAPLLPGVYHYATAQHQLDRLAVGDVTDRVRRALGGHRAAAEADVFLLAAVDFWKNSFKYNSFSYHVVTQDVGALLASWRLVLGGAGLAPPTMLWFDEEPVDAMLGLDGESRSVFAVIPLRWAGSPPPVAQPRSGGARRVVTAASWQRSRTTLTFPLAQQTHRACLVGSTPRPEPVAGAALEVGGRAGRSGVPAEIALPSAEPTLRADVDSVLTERRSSFGLLTSTPALQQADVAAVLAAAAAIRHAPVDVKPAERRPAWTGLWLLANAVDGVPSGAYGYDSTEHRLAPVDAAAETDLGSFLQRHYALTNYNMREVAAVLVITARVDDALRAYGDRGYRMVNTEVGSVAQAAYLAATAARVGCGAVLGLDNIAIDDVLGLDGTGEQSLLFVLLGNERAGHAAFRAGLWSDLPAEGREGAR